MIEVESLSRSYGAFRAVDDVSFRIDHGEVVGLLGHNGAGKTTIMKMLTGFLEPDAGRVRVDGLDIAARRRAVQGRIGYLPENCPLYPDMTVMEHLDYQAGLHGVTEAARPRALGRAIRLTALAPKAMATVATLSRGYRQRLGVALAILHRPRILILDEPTNGLDPSQILHMRDLIRELAREATVILSTHILHEVQAVCDRVLILRNGRLALDARLGELAAARRLLLTVDAAPERIQALLAGVEGLAAPVHLGPGGGGQRYALDLAGAEATAVAPAVARAVLAGGCALLALAPEIRDLETVFGEINAGQEREAA